MKAEFVKKYKNGLIRKWLKILIALQGLIIQAGTVA